MCIYVYVYVYVHTHIYIYIYTNCSDNSQTKVASFRVLNDRAATRSQAFEKTQPQPKPTITKARTATGSLEETFKKSISFPSHKNYGNGG